MKSILQARRTRPRAIASPARSARPNPRRRRNDRANSQPSPPKMRLLPPGMQEPYLRVATTMTSDGNR